MTSSLRPSRYTRKILFCSSSLTYRNPAGSHTGPSVKPKPVATTSSFASFGTSFQNSGDSARNSNDRGGRLVWGQSNEEPARSATATARYSVFIAFLPLEKLLNHSVSSSGFRFVPLWLALAAVTRE